MIDSYTDSLQSQNWRILHIDDDEDDHFLVRSMLRDARGRKVNIEWASTFEEGRQKLRENNFQAVLVDYDLGNATGIQLIREFTTQGYDAPMILLTGRGSYEVDVEAMHAGATLYLTKDEINPLLLERSIRYAIERRQAEEALRLSNERYQTLFDSIDEGFCIVEVLFDETGQPVDYRFLEVNQAFQRQTGLDQAEGQTARGLVPGLEEYWFQIYGQVAKTGQSVRFENFAEGMHRWFSVNAFRVGHPAENKVGILFKDITRRKQVEEALRVSEAAMDAFFAASPGILNLFDEQLRYIKSDPLTPTYFDLDRETIIGKSVKDLNPGYAEAFLEPMLQRVIQSGNPELNVEFTGPIPSRLGELGHFRASYFPVPLPGGRVGLGVIASEITDIRWAEIALQESEARFRDLANNISQLVWMADGTGRIFWHNQRWFDFTGATVEEMRGQGWQNIYHPDHMNRVVEKLKRCFAEGEFWEDTFPLKGKDGQYRWFLSQAVPIRNENGHLVRWFGTSTDISEQRQLEEANRRQKDLLERMLHTVPVGIAFLKGPQHVYYLVNEEYQRYARGKGDLIGCTVLEKWPEVAATILPQMDRVYQTGEPFSVHEAPLNIVRDGVAEEEFFSYTFTPIYQADGSIEGLMILAIDTTASVRDRRAAEAQSAQLSAVLQALPVGVWITDAQGRLVGKNEQADRIWAGDAPLLEGIDQYQRYTAWYPGSGKALLPEEYPVAQALLTGQPVEPIELQIQRFDGAQATVLVSSAPIKDKEGQLAGVVGLNVDITGRKKVEEALRESNERYQALFHSMDQGFCIIEMLYDAAGQASDYRYLEVNQAFEKHTGLMSARGKSIRELVPEIDPYWIELFGQVAETGQPVRYENWASGLQRWFNVNGFRVGQPSEHKVGVLLTDITEQKGIDGAREESEQRYRTLAETLEIERAKLAAVIENMPVGVGVADAEGNTLSLNRAALDLHGFSSEAEMFSRLQSYVDEFELQYMDGRPMPLEDWPASRALRGEYVKEYELCLLNMKTGQKQPVSYSVCPIRSPQGEIIRIVYLMQNLSERQQALEEVKRSRAQLETILDNLAEGVSIVDAGGRIQYMNRTAREILGYASFAEAQQWLPDYEELFAVSTLDGRALTLEEWPLARLVRGESFSGHEVQVRRKDTGREWIGSFSGKPIPNQGDEAELKVFTLRDITHQKWAEAALRESEERYRLAARATNDAIWDWRIGTDVIQWNEALTELFGYPPAEQHNSSGDWWKAHLHPEDAPRIIESINAVIYGRDEVWSATYRFRRADGTYAVIYDRGWVSRDEHGLPLRMVGAMRDITLRTEVENALLEREKQLRQLADSMPQLVWTAKPDGTVDYYNQRYQLFGGIAPMEKDRWEWGPVLHPDDLQTTVEAWQTAIQTGETYQVEHRVRMADGSYRWHLSRGIPAYNDQGQLVKWYGTATDIDDFKHIQEMLRVRELRMNRLFEANLIGILSRDAQGKVLAANDAYLEITGYTCEDIGAGILNVRDITPAEYHPIDQQCTQELLAKGSFKPYEKEYIRKDGARIPVLIGYSLFQNDQTEFIGFVLDLSELKQAQAELAEYAKKLKRSNEELESFAFVASHDLQEPLRKIQMFGNTLRKQQQDQMAPEAEDSLDRIQSAVERMQAMIKGLLDLSRITTRMGEFMPVNLDRVSEEVVSDLEALVRTSGGQVIVDPLPVVMGDALQMRQLLQNLIGNALKFQREGVAPMVRVTGEVVEGEKGSQVKIVVADNGIGFQEKSENQIFQPFVRLHGRSQYEGSGMGLAICRKIVEQHGGSISAQSEPGVGSRFTILLPGIE